jgi:UDP:flavonoid glycosyltransferase YjiC (YdhE family)
MEHVAQRWSQVSTTLTSLADGADLLLTGVSLISSGPSKFDQIPHLDHVKVVGTVNYADVFPSCRAVVHHGGAGTTAAAVRAGIPTLILWSVADQPI